MKRFKLLFAAGLVALGLGVLASPAKADGLSFTIALSTTTPGTAAIAGNAYVRKLIVTSSTATVAETVTVYNSCASSPAVALKFTLGAASATTAQNYSQEFVPRSFKLTGGCFTKSDSTSAVQFTVFYE